LIGFSFDFNKKYGKYINIAVRVIRQRRTAGKREANMNSLVNCIIHPIGFSRNTARITPDGGGSQNTGVRKKFN
jgi:hypothetical protein